MSWVLLLEWLLGLALCGDKLFKLAANGLHRSPCFQDLDLQLRDQKIRRMQLVQGLCQGFPSLRFKLFKSHDDHPN